jgi:ribosome-associated protein
LPVLAVDRREHALVSESASRPTRDVPIRDETIRLGQLLKLANLASSGSEAHRLLEAEEVHVNGETETRRGRMLRVGDLVTVSGAEVRVISQASASVDE